MRLPTARGPLSRDVLERLAAPEPFDADPPVALLQARDVDVLSDEDVQLTLWVLYELHYRGFEDVADQREWDPEVLRLRQHIETAFEAALRRGVADPVREAADSPAELPAALLTLIESMESPPLAAFLHRTADREQVLEFLAQRSLYHLKESDPHAFVVPRIDGPAKVALAELQYDEYGSGRPEALHAKLFGDALEGCGLDRTYGAYVDRTPGRTLAVNNVMSLFGLHRRLRGAALGHLAAFEATSSVPCRKIAAGIERVGLPDVVSAYFHEHVEADAVHEQVAVRTICGGLVEAEPELREDVLFGAAACLHLDALAAEELLAAWAPQSHLEAAS